METCWRGGALTGAILAVSAFAAAQSVPAAPPSPIPAGAAYTYSSDGRRDPFVSLIAGDLESPTGKRLDGLAGLSTEEVVVRGVLVSRGGYLALVSGNGGKTYVAHVHDRLVDGTITEITPQGLVVMQEVSDPLSVIKQRAVRKGFKTADDEK